MRRTLLAALIALTAGCGGGEADDLGAGDGSLARQQEQAPVDYTATLINESGKPASVVLTYWIVRPFEYGTNRGWQPLLNVPLAAGESKGATLSVPKGEQVAVQLGVWSGGRWQDVYVEAEPQGALSLTISAAGAPSIQWVGP